MWSFLRRPSPKRCTSLVQHWSPNPAQTAQQRLTTSPDALTAPCLSTASWARHTSRESLATCNTQDKQKLLWAGRAGWDSEPQVTKHAGHRTLKLKRGSPAFLLLLRQCGRHGPGALPPTFAKRTTSTGRTWATSRPCKWAIGWRAAEHVGHWTHGTRVTVHHETLKANWNSHCVHRCAVGRT